MVSVVEANEETFPLVYEYLRREGSPRITHAAWRRLIDKRWHAPERHFGYALVAGGKVVGFLGYLFSVQEIDGQERRFCNVSTFVVDPAHRNQSLRLVAPLAALRGHTMVNVTPSADAGKIFKALGFRELDAGVTALLPLPDPRGLLASRRAGVVFDEEKIAKLVTGRDARVFADHRGLAGRHMLLTTPQGATTYVMATRRAYRNVPFAHVQYVGDPALFAERSDVARVALMLRLGVPLVLVDRRMLHGHDVARSIQRDYPSPLLYRSKEVTPAQISNAYTELTLFPV